MTTPNDREEAVLRHKAIVDFINGKDKRCLVCGAKEQCELKDDLNSPCIFDPTPRELFTTNQALGKEITVLHHTLQSVEADRDHLRSLLTRAYTELNGDDMDKVRGVLAEIAQEIP